MGTHAVSYGDPWDQMRTTWGAPGDHMGTCGGPNTKKTATKQPNSPQIKPNKKTSLTKYSETRNLTARKEITFLGEGGPGQM